MEKGHCQCQEISYSFQREDVISAHHCHCRDCQRSTGSGKATIIYVPKKHLTIEGELKYFESKGSMGMHIKRGFCHNCGSGILSYAKELPMILFVKAGTLIDSSWVEIKSSYFSDSAQAWNKVDDDIKSFKGNPDIISNIKSVIKAL